jgi:hypothetical protein
MERIRTRPQSTCLWIGFYLTVSLLGGCTPSPQDAEKARGGAQALGSDSPAALDAPMSLSAAQFADQHLKEAVAEVAAQNPAYQIDDTDLAALQEGADGSLSAEELAAVRTASAAR